MIESPSSTKNRDKKRDLDTHSAKKGSTWHFGHKAHVGVDHESGLVHTLEAAVPNEHDVCMTANLLTGEEQVVYGNSGYLGAENVPRLWSKTNPVSKHTIPKPVKTDRKTE